MEICRRLPGEAGFGPGAVFVYLYNILAAIFQPTRSAWPTSHIGPSRGSVSMDHRRSDRGHWAKSTSVAVLGVYWAALFVATHVPQVSLPLEPSDKVLHASAFSALAFLLAFTWSLRGPFGLRQCVAVLVIVAAYGALDEATQPLVGRTADVLDWIADIVGASVGLAILLAVRTALRRQA